MLRCFTVTLTAIALLCPTSGAQAIYSTTFDDDSGWTFDGDDPAEWAVDATPPTIEALGYCGAPGPVSYVSAPSSLNFNDGMIVGDSSFGTATSPFIDLTGATDPKLQFQAAWCYEKGCQYDTAIVQVSNDGFASTELNFCFTANAGPSGEWQGYSYDLHPSWGTVQIRFMFFTVDDLFNLGSGWFIDDLVVNDCDEPPPVNYCVGAPNSAGSGAMMEYAGSPSVTTDDLVLIADGVPQNQLSLFLYGPNQGMAPNGDGVFCLSSPFYRIYPASPTGIQGVAIKHLDIANPPVPAAQILAGATWNFINWYRDPAAGGAGYNFSDGLQVTFCR